MHGLMQLEFTWQLNCGERQRFLRRSRTVTKQFIFKHVLRSCWTHAARLRGKVTAGSSGSDRGPRSLTGPRWCGPRTYMRCAGLLDLASTIRWVLRAECPGSRLVNHDHPHRHQLPIRLTFVLTESE